jgi:hypothetical protein
MGKRLVSLVGFGLILVALTTSAAFGLVINVRISNGNDDVEEHLDSGSMDFTSTDLEFPHEDDGSPSATDPQLVGLRFNPVPIPRGAEVTKAYLEFEMDETKGNNRPVNVIIEGQLVADAPAFESVSRHLTNRQPRTTAQVKWTVPLGLAVDVKFQSPDISSIIREIINQDGWVAGNAMVFIIRDDPANPSTGIRCVEAYNGEPTAAPLLYAEVFSPTAHTPNPADGAVGVFMPLLTWAKGDDAILHNVYIGRTPDLTEAERVATNLPVTMYYHLPGLEPGGLYYWRVDEVDLAGKVTPGPVWSFVAQAETAYYPSPADGSKDVSPTPVLTWQAGLAAMKHRVYFGDNHDAVAQGASGTDKGEMPNPTFTPPALDSVTTYYWRVDEIGLGNAVKTGPVWSFTTHLPVDDFESYTDDEGKRIYETWIDGWTNNTGSTVGNTTAPFAERTIVRSGQQSMPLDYNNVKSPFYSEAELDFAPVQNWTANELAELRLDFRGRGGNGVGALYVAAEDSTGKSAVVTHTDPAAVTTTTWTQWKIPLNSFAGVNLARVKTLYIGIGNRASPVAGGAGRIYIDDIRVTKP